MEASLPLKGKPISYPCEALTDEDKMVTSIEFTQYRRPRGRPSQVVIDRPHEIADRARELKRHGYCFECEVLTTGQVSMTISKDENIIAHDICDNGPEVPKMVDKLIKNCLTPKEE